MSKLPRNLKPQKLIKFLQKQGFSKSGGRGSHIRLVHADDRWTQVAAHPGPVPIGTLRKIISQSGLNEDQIKEL